MILIYGSLILAVCAFLYYFVSYVRLCKHLRVRAKKYVDKLYPEHDKIRRELNEKEINLQYKEKTINFDYNKLKDSFNKRVEEIKANYEKKKKEDEEELNTSIAEVEEELKKSIEEIDKVIGDKITDLTLKNTLTFDCVCGATNIPCFIDLTKENTFRCKKCNSVYSVQTKFSPVIIGKATSEGEFLKIVEKRMQEEGMNDEL